MMSRRWLRSMGRSVPWWQVWMVVAAVVTAVGAARPAGALDDDPPGETDVPPVLGCLSQVRGSISALPSYAVVEGQPVTVSWSWSVPSGCSGVTVKATGSGLYWTSTSSTARSDTKTFVPVGDPSGNSYAQFALTATKTGIAGVHPLDTAAVKITPITTTAYGRRTVYINHSWQVQSFVEAVGVPNTTVMLANHVHLNLSYWGDVKIAPGVHILGGWSSSQVGPRLYTTGTPYRATMLLIGGHFAGTEERHPADGVRIMGIRLDGGNMGIADADVSGPIGIRVQSSVNVEIAHNEIYGWSGSGVEVLDDLGRLSLANATAVWVHDNYFHHNRHWEEQGYGVSTNTGAYTLIERNVFDYNRHALKSAPEEGTGYLAYHNLVLANGGENTRMPFTDTAIQHTHQLDVHGSADDGWGRDAYAGHAGEYFDYRYNTFTYTAGDVLKVRGYPDIGADVAHNVFAKCGSGAIVQTDGSNLLDHGNNLLCWYGSWNQLQEDVCDFDGDGQVDDFWATGRTWWFKGATGQWHYLNTDGTLFPTGSNPFVFEHANFDGRCDVRKIATGAIYSGGRGPKRLVPLTNTAVAAQRTDVVWEPGAGGVGRVRIWQLENAAIQRDITVHADTATAQLLGTGDFNADGATDLLWRDAQGAVSVTLLEADGTEVEPIGGRSPVKGTMPLSTQMAGIGDFNADGRADVLWRHANGQLEVWFAGEAGNSAKVTWLNNIDPQTGAPIDAPVPVDWQVEGVGDFDGDGYSDILWRHNGGQVAIWYMLHAMHVGDAYPGGTDPDRVWEIQGVGDFDGDGHADILWRDVQGYLAIWVHGQYDTGLRPTWQNQPGGIVEDEWQIHGIGDFNADGRADILWRHTGGTVAIWMMNGGTYLGESAALPIENTWQLRGLLAQGFQRLDLQ